MPGSVSAIILAAGKSTRMGRPKALLPLERADTFLTHLIATFRAADIRDVVVVLGHEARTIVEALGALPTDARIVVNDGYEAGQLSSLLAGLGAVDSPNLAAVLVIPVDVPLVTASTVCAVVERHQQTQAPIVRPVRGARHGHPVLIDRALFGALRALEASQGANQIVRAHASPAGDVDVSDEGAFSDVDTPDEYEEMIARVQTRRAVE